MDTPSKTGNSFMERYLTPIAVLAGAIIIAFAFLYGHGTAPTAATPGQPAQAVAVNIKDVKTDNDPYVGDKNAPVTMALWFDYQCPFCKQLDQNTVSQIYENYVKTGKVRIVFKDFQFLGPDSDTAALFARAVWAQSPDHFYDWYTAMFNAQDAEGNVGFGNLDSIEKLTRTIPGIDTDKVIALMNQNKDAYTAAIAADRTEGGSFGIQGTPSLIIGTTMLSGAQDYSAVAPLLDAQLKK